MAHNHDAHDPSASGPHDALGLLRRQHRRIEELLAQLKDPSEREGVLDALTATLKEHVDATEAIFYPAIREAARDRGERGGGEPTLKLLVKGVRQHGEVLQSLGNANSGTGIEELERQLQRHLDDEETGIMTVAEDLLRDDQLFDLGRRMSERKQVLEAQQELARTVAPTARGWLRWAIAGAGLLLGGLAAARRLARRPQGRDRDHLG
jgi:hypothetical protein